MAVSTVLMGITDENAEKSTFGAFLPLMTAANFDATITAVAAVIAAVDGVTLEPVSREIIKAVDLPFGPRSTVPNAQREAKWRVVWTDPTDAIGNGSMEIPCPDLIELAPGTGKMDIGAGNGLALKNAIEANLVSRLGNAIVVQEVVHVGRNI